MTTMQYFVKNVENLFFYENTKYTQIKNGELRYVGTTYLKYKFYKILSKTV